MEACLALFNRLLQSFIVHNKKQIKFADMTDAQILHIFFEVPANPHSNQLLCDAPLLQTNCGNRRVQMMQTRADDGNIRVLGTDGRTRGWQPLEGRTLPTKTPGTWRAEDLAVLEPNAKFKDVFRHNIPMLLYTQEQMEANIEVPDAPGCAAAGVLDQGQLYVV